MSITQPTNDADLLGRDDVDDLDAIMAVSNTDATELIHAVKDNADAIFTWDYEKGARPALNKLYEKAKVSQWNGETDLPWDTAVDPEQVIANAPMDPENDPVLVAATGQSAGDAVRPSTTEPNHEGD